MDLEINISEVNQTERNKYHSISFICGILKKNSTCKLIYKAEIVAQM